MKILDNFRALEFWARFFGPAMSLKTEVNAVSIYCQVDMVLHHNHSCGEDFIEKRRQFKYAGTYFLLERQNLLYAFPRLPFVLNL